MFQEIDPYKYHNEYIPKQPEAEDYLVISRGNEILIKEQEDTFVLPMIADLKGEQENLLSSCIYLFSIDRKSFFRLPDFDENQLDGFVWKVMHYFRTAKPRYLSFAAVTGLQLNRWYNSRRFCGCCGRPLQHAKKERMMYCPHCNIREFPQISPAVIIGIRNGDKLLLSKYAGRDYVRHAMIAGFAEIGETIEETVHREVMEEVGLKVKNLQYYKSQPWSFSGSLLFGFFCDLDGSPEITLDEEELSMAEWVDRQDIPEDDTGLSLTMEMMQIFRKGLDHDYNCDYESRN